MTARHGVMGPEGTAPRISIVLPVYNVAGYVGACLWSLREQTFEDFEVIVVDDGSTDGSLQAIWGAIGTDARFRVLSRRNGGLSAARNTGLGQIRGDYVAFVDSDDRVAPTYLATLLEAITATGADWAACAVRFCDADGATYDHSAIHGAPFPAIEGSAPAMFRFDEWSDVIRHFPSAWNKLYRRSLIEGLRFIEGTYYEDHPFYYEAAARTDGMAYVTEPLYLQTQGRAGQITRDGTDRVFEQFGVLDALHDIMRRSSRPGVEIAMARIATRLIFERAGAIRDPERRRQFARASRDYLDARGLHYAPDWDRNISRTWGRVIDGHLPLSVVVLAEQADTALNETLGSLARQTFRDFEILLVQAGPNDGHRQALLTTAAGHPNCSVLTNAQHSRAAACNRGIAAAQGDLLLLLESGDRLAAKKALGTQVEFMTRTEADVSSAPIPTAIKAPKAQSASDTLPYKVATATPETFLSAPPSLANMLLRRDYLEDSGLRFTDGPLSQWIYCLEAQLGAVSMLRYDTGLTWPALAGQARGADIASSRDALDAAIDIAAPELRDMAEGPDLREALILLAQDHLGGSVPVSPGGKTGEPAG